MPVNKTGSFTAELEEIYRRNVDRVYRIAYLRLGNRADAEDAAQNVFTRFMRSPRTFRDAEHEKAYFLTAARNESVSILRSPWHSRRTDFYDLPEAETEDPQDDGAVVRALCRLPHPHREVLYLYYFEGYSSREIASLIGRSESAVRSRLQAARDRLKPILQTELEEEE